MVDKKLLRQLKGKIKTTKKFRDKIKELELEQDIQQQKEEIPKKEVEKQIKDIIIKKPLVKIELGKFLIQL